MYVIKRIDRKGGYVARTGAQFSYTNTLQHAKVFFTKDAAERDRCAGNEIIISIRDLLQGAA